MRSSGLGLVLLSAAFAWRIRPAAGALAAIAILADHVPPRAHHGPPASTSRRRCSPVAYLALGLKIAVRRGSSPICDRRGSAVRRGVPGQGDRPCPSRRCRSSPRSFIDSRGDRSLRTAGWLTLSATVAVAPWFIFVADVGDRVYRLGTPPGPSCRWGSALLGVALAGILGSRLPLPAGCPHAPRRSTGGFRTHPAGDRGDGRVGARSDPGLHRHAEDPRHRADRPPRSRRLCPGTESGPDPTTAHRPVSVSYSPSSLREIPIGAGGPPPRTCGSRRSAACRS